MNMRHAFQPTCLPHWKESDLSKLFCKEDSITKMVILFQDLGGGTQGFIVLTRVYQL